MLEELQSRPDLILAVVRYDHRLRGAVEQFKAIVRLADGTPITCTMLASYTHRQFDPCQTCLTDWKRGSRNG